MKQTVCIIFALFFAVAIMGAATACIDISLALFGDLHHSTLFGLRADFSLLAMLVLLTIGSVMGFCGYIWLAFESPAERAARRALTLANSAWEGAGHD